MNDLFKLLLIIILIGAIANVLAQPYTLSFLSDAGEWLFLLCVGGVGIVLLAGIAWALYRLGQWFSHRRQNRYHWHLREKELEIQRLQLAYQHTEAMADKAIVMVEGRVPVSVDLVKNGDIPYEILQLLAMNIEGHRTAALPKSSKQRQYQPKYDDVETPTVTVIEDDNGSDNGLITQKEIIKLDTPLQQTFDLMEEGERLALAQTFEQSTPDSWILGQNPDDGTLLRYSPRNDVHLSVLGGTGCGKTSNSAFHLALFALMSGMHLIILDGKDGLDWRVFTDYAEFYEVDWNTLSGYVEHIIQHYERRMATLKEHGASNIYELPNNPFQPLFVIFEEYGSVAQALKGEDRSLFDAMNRMLDELLRKSRATGIYMTLLDQVPENYSKQMIGNVKLKLVYKLGGMSGNTVAEYHTKDLADRGQFSCSNVFYNAWFVEPELKKYFKMLHTNSHSLLTGGVQENTTGDTPPNGAAPVPAPPKTPILGNNAPEMATAAPPDTGASTSAEIADTSTNTTPKLMGEPTTEREKALVWEIYRAVGSKNKAIELLWGTKNTKRMHWLNAVLNEQTA